LLQCLHMPAKIRSKVFRTITECWSEEAMILKMLKELLMASRALYQSKGAKFNDKSKAAQKVLHKCNVFKWQEKYTDGFPGKTKLVPPDKCFIFMNKLHERSLVAGLKALGTKAPTPLPRLISEQAFWSPDSSIPLDNAHHELKSEPAAIVSDGNSSV